MTEPAGDVTGSVEREARQLVEAAARWLSAVPDREEYAGRAPEQDTDAESSAGSGDEGGSGAAWFGASGAQEQASGEHLCRGCPWCRAKAAAAGPIGTDALESLAHLLGSAAESLSLFAQSRREAAQASEQDESGPGEA